MIPPISTPMTNFFISKKDKFYRLIRSKLENNCTLSTFSYFGGVFPPGTGKTNLPELCRTEKTTTKFNDSYPSDFSMQNNDQILEAIEHYLGQIGYPEEPGRPHRSAIPSMMSGKRLRPMLLMLTCGIFSDQPQAGHAGSGSRRGFP